MELVIIMRAANIYFIILFCVLSFFLASSLYVPFCHHYFAPQLLSFLWIFTWLISKIKKHDNKCVSYSVFLFGFKYEPSNSISCHLSSLSSEKSKGLNVQHEYNKGMWSGYGGAYICSLNKNRSIIMPSASTIWLIACIISPIVVARRKWKSNKA